MSTPQAITLATINSITPTRLYGPHNTFLTALAYSPNAHLLITGDYQGMVKVWQVEQGVQCASKRIFQIPLQRIAFGQASSDGAYRVCAIANRDEILTFDLSSEGKLANLQYVSQQDYTLLDVTFSPDNRPVVACVQANAPEDSRLYLVYGDNRDLLSAFRSGNDTNPNACFSADGALVAVGHDDGSVSIRGTRTNGAERHRLQTEFDGIKRTQFSADGNRLAVIEERGDSIAVYDTNSGERIGGVLAGTFPHEVCLNADGTLLMVSNRRKGGSMHIYNAETGQVLRTIKASSPFAFSPQGSSSFAAGNNYAVHSKSAMLWDERESPDGILSKAMAPVDALAAQTFTIRQLSVLNSPGKQVRVLAFSPDNSILATAADDDDIHLWSLHTGGATAVLHQHSGEITDMVFSPSGRMLASCSGHYNDTSDNTVRLWDMDENEQIFVFRGHGSRVVGVRFLPGGERLVSAETDRVVLVWDATDGRVQQRLETPSVINSFAVSPNGAIVATTHGSELALKDTTVRLWNVQTGEMLREIAQLNDWVLSAQFSPDGNVLMVADYSGRVCGWDVNTGEQVRDINGGFSLLYSPLQDLIALAQDKSVKMTSTQDNALLMTLRHGSNVMSMAFSPESDLFGVGTKEGQVVVWGVPQPSTDARSVEDMEAKRLEQARSGRHTLQLLQLTCVQAQERDGDEVFIRLDGQTIWAVENAGRKMHHAPGNKRDVQVFDFKACRMLGQEGWQQTGKYMPSDFRFSGLTGPVDIELWEEDNFLRGGNDFFGRITVSPTQAGQGEQEQVFYQDGVNYVLTYEVVFD